MSESWMSLAIVWAIFEGIQYFRKVPFPRRMVAPLVCVAIGAGLMSAGYAPSGANYAAHFFIGTAIGAVFGVVFYSFRLLMVKIWGGFSIREDVDLKPSIRTAITLLKKILISIGVVVVIMGVARWGYEAYTGYRYRQEISARRALDDAVEVVAFRPTPEEKLCPPAWPYIYVVRNNSGKIVDSVSFNVHVRKNGFSNILNSAKDYNEFYSDKILKPGDAWAQCFKVNVSGYPYVTGEVNEKDVQIEVVNKTVYFGKLSNN